MYSGETAANDRGFILMSDHREAVDAMRRTDGKVIG